MEFIRIGQAADQLGVSVATVRRWIDCGLVEAIRLPTNRERRVPTKEVQRLRHKMRLAVTED